MIKAIRVILAALMLAPVLSPEVGRAFAAPPRVVEADCCCRGGMAGIERPALPCHCPGAATCALMQEPPAGLAAFLPSTPYRLSLDLWAGPGPVVAPALGEGWAADDPPSAKQPPGPLFLLKHALLI